MKMRQVMKIELPAGTRVTLEPGGLHVMFMGLNQRPEMGDTVALTLTFADGSQTTITIPVKMIKGMKKHGRGGQRQHQLPSGRIHPLIKG